MTIGGAKNAVRETEIISLANALIKMRGKIMTSDLRARASLFIAGLIAEGTTLLFLGFLTWIVDTKRLKKKFSNLGATINRIK